MELFRPQRKFTTLYMYVYILSFRRWGRVYICHIGGGVVNVKHAVSVTGANL